MWIVISTYCSDYWYYGPFQTEALAIEYANTKLWGDIKIVKLQPVE